MNMRRTAPSIFAGVALCLGLAMPVAAQPAPGSSGAPNYPAWTGNAYPLAQHLQVMLLNSDQTALSMAQTAQQSATSAAIKQLAADVASERTRDIATLRSAYSKRYGQTPPARPAPQRIRPVRARNDGRLRIGERLWPGHDEKWPRIIGQPAK